MNAQAVAKGILRMLMQNLNHQNPVASGPAISPLSGVGGRPYHDRAGILKLFIVTTSSLYFGGLLAHKGASYLEENEIFVPDDDDDDD